jgi:hypothetical protein
MNGSLHRASLTPAHKYLFSISAKKALESRAKLALLRQMNLHESDCTPNNLARSFVIVLIIEAVNALRVVYRSKRNFSRAPRAQNDRSNHPSSGLRRVLDAQ